MKIENGEHAALNTAEAKQVWGPVTLTADAETRLSPNGGFVWDEDTRTLTWTWYHGYKTGDAPPVLAATTLAEDGAVTSAGPWRVTSPDGLYKSYWGGVMTLPAEFADQYTGGCRLATWFWGLLQYLRRGEPRPGPRHHPAARPAADLRTGYSAAALCGGASALPVCELGLSRGSRELPDHPRVPRRHHIGVERRTARQTMIRLPCTELLLLYNLPTPRVLNPT